ncbi:nucleoside-diphosphate-sugar epimerase [Algoriphagus boseongensis]|uniref:Nucleoside-diphosphate-sugar epimerase n=1 Tax=Algoriphagus boseongensis TaxID=1442587 RepID=A0A4R6T5W2_9BACT|nr:NAD-dependent epimerase/dehydratase family protein [Algoriphagus boseongensis]TDQ18508.1 nucleoside-diphosphate-sugar epimerase [Algoriphagus boseongensis]
MKLHTILGANGNIGIAISHELHLAGIQVRQVSRNPKKIHESDEVFVGDLLDSVSIREAVKGSEVVYLCAGITYSAKIWERDWPIIMKNTLEACIAENCKLVFFDNMYALDPDEIGHLTEKTPMNPKSRKGKVRKQILEMLWQKVNSGDLTAMVVRAADFYGPDAKNSFLQELVINRVKAGKSPQWTYSGDKKHSFTFIPDAGKATVQLALHQSAWNQTWNLPTDPSYPSAREITQLLNEKLGKNTKLMVMPDFMVWLLGWFIPPLKEIREIKYQTAEDYCFDSSKIENAFELKPTPFEEGLESCL